MLKWTIGIVNYKTSVYMKWQLKSFYEFNDPKDFQLVIVDNSRDEAEKEALLDVTRPYSDRHGNIKIIFHTPVEPTASGQHGEGLTLILKEHADSQYILFQDPDFFWVRKNILNWFEEFLNRDKVAVGAPYPRKAGGGHALFPCAYGCAHRVADIKHLDVTADASEGARQRSFRIYPLADGWEFSYDVGWKLRVALSTPNNDKNFISFRDTIAPEVNRIIGPHSFATITRRYSYKGRNVAYHLFRGSFTGKVTSEETDPNMLTPQAWLDAREKFGALFYDILCNNGKTPASMNNIDFKDRMYQMIVRSRYGSLMNWTITTLKKSAIGTRLVQFLKKHLKVDRE